MVRFTRILCPVDLSDVSAEAARHARALADWYGASLTILQVVAVSEAPMAYASGGSLLPLATQEERQAALDALTRFADVAHRAGPTEVAIREGAIVPQVLDVAHQLAADLIVMGTHGRSGFDRFLLGSVTEKVMRRAPCPVMTIPPAPASWVASDPLYRSILCAIDFSPSSLRALDYALSLAQESQANLVLLHVVDAPTDQPLAAWSGPAFATQLRQTREQADEELRRAVPDEARAWCQPETVVTVGRPHEEIVRVAAERHAGLIVLGVHGRSTLHEVFFGSTASQVVRHAACPVLSIRPVASAPR